MIRYAEKEKSRFGYTNITFELGDASDLSRFANGMFDISMATLLFHETSQEKQLSILLEMKRVSKMVIVADYIIQSVFPKQLIDLMENTIGISHSSHYKLYKENGGMPYLLEKAGLSIKTYETAMIGMLGIWSCK